MISADSASAETGIKKWSSKAGSLLAAAMIFLPVLCTILLVKQNTVNVPHYDDFTFLEDWLHYKTGKLTWSDLFSVHLEHRVTVPRLMALGAHILGGSDLRWQNGLTLLLMMGTLWNVLAIWRRTAGGTLRQGWLPLMLMSSALFCAVQWQSLLWPILFEIFPCIYCFTLALRLWAGSMNPWLALGLSALLCAAGMFSFGNGPLTWLLMPFAIWFQRPDLDKTMRWKLVGAWIACLAVMMALYFHNFHNSAPKQFAYDFDSQMTAKDTVSSSLTKMFAWNNFLSAVEFCFAVLGSHLNRGLHLNSLLAAQWIGGISVALFCAALVGLFLQRRQTELLRRAMPWVLIGLFSAGTGALITLGRVWLTRSGIIALLPRYMSHSVPLTVSLVALAWILGRPLIAQRPWLRTTGALAGGALFFLLGTEWIYGSRCMDQWRNARLQNRAMLMFSEVLPDKQFLGPITGEGGYGADVMIALNRIGQSPVPLLKNLRLDQFHPSVLTLRHRQAGFNELHDTKNGGLYAVGYAELPNQRPADLILFSTPDEKGVEQIFGLDYALRLPNYLHAATYKDHDGFYMDVMNPKIYAKWEGNITLLSKLARNAPIKAWALDVERNTVYRIPDNRTTQEPLPPLPQIPEDE